MEIVEQYLAVSSADAVLIALTFAMIVLDVISGVCKGAFADNIDSKVLKRGGFHKAGFLLLIVLGYFLQVVSQFAQLGYEVPTIGAVCVYIILTEAVSVLENLCEINPAIASSPIAKVLAETNHKE